MTSNTKQNTNIRPMAGYALIEPTELEKTTSAGIILPDTHEEKSQRGKVIAVGASQVTESGKEIKAGFSIGDTVVYKKWGGEEIKMGVSGKELIFVKFDDVLAIIE